MAPERLNLIRQIGAKYWQAILSLAVVIASAFKVIRDSTSGLTTIQTWLFAGVGLLFIIAIRFPKVAVAMTRLIIGPPKSPTNLPTIFKGPRPYSSADKDRFPGRQKESADCWALIEVTPFLIIDGESGCGKSSLLNAALLPRAREKFRVVECRIADDPFGKLYAALLKEQYRKSDDGVRKEELSAAIALAVESYTDPSAPDDQRGPLLLCFDQFEELFASVRDEVRNQFVDALKDSIGSGNVRVVLALRSDFFDLLMKVCDAVDPDRDIVNLGNYYTLRAFRKEQAESVLEQILEPICSVDPALKPQMDDFARALIDELLRPPRDKRLSKDDEKAVLPVELQTVGMMIESSGLKNFSVAGLKGMGGKIGLFKDYIEEAKIYVWRKTGVPGERALLILRQLISPAQTKGAQSPQSIAIALNIPSEQVEKVLKAFSDRYLVNPLPLATDVRELRTARLPQEYELMHEHLVQILIEAPDPILQRARDSEERLRFWNERTKSTNQIDKSRKLQSMRTRLSALFAQPVPLGETLSLWKFAHSGNERRMLKRSICGFGMRLAVVALAVSLPVSGLYGWTLTDQYQIQRILSDAPTAQAALFAANPSDEGRTAMRLVDEDVVGEWIKALACMRRIDDAIAASRNIKDDDRRSDVMTGIALLLLDIGRANEAVKILDDAFRGRSRAEEKDSLFFASEPIAQRVTTNTKIADLAEAMARAGKSNEMVASLRKIDSVEVRSIFLSSAAHGMLKAGKSADANQALDEAISSVRAIGFMSNRITGFINLSKELINAKRLDAARNLTDEILLAARGEESLKGKVDDVIYVLVKLGRNGLAKQVLAEAQAPPSAAELAKRREIIVSHPPPEEPQPIKVARSLAYLGMPQQALAVAIGGPNSTSRKDHLADLARDSSIGEIMESLFLVGRAGDAKSILRSYAKDGDWVLAMRAQTFVTNTDIETILATLDQVSISTDSKGWNPIGAVIDSLVALGRLQEAFTVFCSKDEYRTKHPTSLSDALVSSQKLDASQSAVRNVNDARNRSVVTASIATGLAKAGRVGETKQWLDEALSTDTNWDSFWADVFQRTSKRLIKAGKIDDALDCANIIKNEDARLEALVIIAGELVEADKIDKAKEILNGMLPNIETVKDMGTRSRIIPRAVLLMNKAGMNDQAKKYTEEALAVTLEEKKEEFWASVESAEIVGLARVGKVDEAKAAFKRATFYKKDIHSEDPNARRQAFIADFAVALARSGNIAAIVETASLVELNYPTFIFARVAVDMAKAGQPDQAMKAAKEIKEIDYQSRILLEVSRQLAKVGKTGEALTVAKEIGVDIDRSRAFAIVGQELARSRSLRLARLTADNCASPLDKLRVYTAILLEAAKGKDPKLQARLETDRIINSEAQEANDEEFVNYFRPKGLL